MHTGQVFRLLMAALFLGCAGPATVERMIYDDPTVLVRLKSSLTKENGHAEPYSHPATFAEGELSVLLRSVTVRKEVSFLNYYVLRRDPTAERAFTDSDLVVLTPHLKVAFAKAHPQEMIVFLVNRTREDGISEITSGGMFLRGELLCVSLTNVRVPVTTARKMEHFRNSPLTSLGEPDFSFVPGPHQSLLKTGESFSPLPSARSSPALAITYRALLTASPASERPAADTRPASSESHASSIEEKLQTLKSWREQGLITDQDYQRKRQELLDLF